MGERTIDDYKKTLKIAMKIVDETVKEKIEAVIEENITLTEQIKNRAVRGFFGRQVDRFKLYFYLKLRIGQRVKNLYKRSLDYTRSKYIIR